MDVIWVMKYKTGLKVTLLYYSCLQMSMLALATVLPEIRNTFPQYSYGRIQAAVTLPDLLVMLTAIPVGKILGKYSKKKLLIVSCSLFILIGWGGFFFHQYFWQIHLWSALLGIAIGILIPTVNSIINEEFEGKEKSQMIGSQNASVSWGAILVLISSGIITAKNWDRIYLIYLLALPAFVFILVFMPSKRKNNAQKRITKRKWKSVFFMSFITFVFFSVYNAISANMSMYLEERQIYGSGSISFFIALLLLGSALTGMLYDKIYSRIKNAVIDLGLLLLVGGLVILSLTQQLFFICLGILLAGTSLSIVMAGGTMRLYETEPKEYADLSVAVMMAASDGGGFCSFIYTYMSQVIFMTNKVSVRYQMMAGIILTVFVIWRAKEKEFL